MVKYIKFTIPTYFECDVQLSRVHYFTQSSSGTFCILKNLKFIPIKQQSLISFTSYFLQPTCYFLLQLLQILELYSIFVTVFFVQHKILMFIHVVTCVRFCFQFFKLNNILFSFIPYFVHSCVHGFLVDSSFQLFCYGHW